jgi:hypothetical protein
MTSISPVSATTYYGYSLAGLPTSFTAPSAPTSAATATPSTSSSSGAATPASDQVAMANLALESQMANNLFGAPPSSPTTSSFFSSAAMFSLLGTQGSAVISYLKSQSSATTPTTPTVDATV